MNSGSLKYNTSNSLYLQLQAAISVLASNFKAKYKNLPNGHCASYFPCCCNQVPDGSNLREKGFALAQFRANRPSRPEVDTTFKTLPSEPFYIVLKYCHHLRTNCSNT